MTTPSPNERASTPATPAGPPGAVPAVGAGDEAPRSQAPSGAPAPGPDARYPMPDTLPEPDFGGGDPSGAGATATTESAKGGTAKPARRGVGGQLLAAVREFVVVGAIALILSFLVKTFLVQAFYIPSESMESTLIENDRVIVSKLTPGLVDLHRGDVVVFQDPDQWLSPQPTADRGSVLNALVKAATFVGVLPDTAEGHLIKRVIGLPGDKVRCCDTEGRVEVNGDPISEPYVKAGEQPSEIDFDITVPAGKIWVMGDNRGHSSDSRLHDVSGKGTEGSVDVDLVTGRAFVLVWPIGRAGWLSNYAPTFAAVPGP